MKRWMVAAALTLTAAAGILTPGAAQASTRVWTPIYQSDGSGYFYQTAAINKNNIFSVGVVFTATGATIYKPFIRHFNGRSWSVMTIPHATDSTANWVSASASNNVWVGGLKNSSLATSVVYRWNGASWTRIPVPAETFLQGVVVLAPNNVWAFGPSGTVPDDVFHWNGVKWQGYLSSSLNFIPQGISASSAGNVWVSGYAWSGSNTVVTAYRWDGRSWHAGMPHPVFNNGGPNVTVVSTTDVWIGWWDNTAQYALHYDGHGWHTVTAPSYANTMNILPDGQGGYWFGPGAILTGSTWSTELLPAFGGTYTNVTRVPGTSWFLLNAGVATGTSSTLKPTIFRFMF